MENIRILFGIIILLVSLNLNKLDIEFLIDTGPTVRSILEMSEPNKELVLEIKENDFITNDKDRAELSLVAYEFSKRIPGYITDIQTLQDIHAEATKALFEDRYKGKYKNISKLMGSEAISSVVGEKNIYLTDELRTELSNKFYATAWVLGD